MEPGEPKFEEELKRESGVQRFVGFTSEEEKNFSEHFRKLFEDQKDPEITFKKYEREKTEEEKLMFAAILEKLPEFIKKYGGNPLSITLDHVHILDIEKMDDKYKEKVKGKGACYLARQELMYVIDYRNDLENAHNLVHELIHFNSFQSIEGKNIGDKKVYNSRRVGLEVFNKVKDVTFFSDMNEAITEELHKRFDREYFESTHGISDEVRERNSIKKYAGEKGEDISMVSLSDGGSGETTFRVKYYDYQKERERWNALIDNLFDENKDQFSSREEVFEVFARAAMSGNLLPLARLLKKTYPKTKNLLRKLGELTKQET